jgi:hypothetical protein
VATSAVDCRGSCRVQCMLGAERVVHDGSPQMSHYSDGEEPSRYPVLLGETAPGSAESLGSGRPRGLSSPLLTFSVEYPEQLSRWMVLVKFILLIPHYVVLSILGWVFGITTLIALVAILFTRQYPRLLWNFAMMFFRWTANVETYLYLQRDEYPPFSTEPYPVRLELDYPPTLSRWLPLVKWILILPAAIVLAFVKLAALGAVAIAFFAILISGRYPPELFRFVTGVNQWNYRINAYAGLLTDAYPPFSWD